MVEEKKDKFSIVILSELFISNEYDVTFPLISKSFGLVPSVINQSSPVFGL